MSVKFVHVQQTFAGSDLTSRRSLLLALQQQQLAQLHPQLELQVSERNTLCLKLQNKK